MVFFAPCVHMLEQGHPVTETAAEPLNLPLQYLTTPLSVTLTLFKFKGF